jgi:hypothetical protein
MVLGLLLALLVSVPHPAYAASLRPGEAGPSGPVALVASPRTVVYGAGSSLSAAGLPASASTTLSVLSAGDWLPEATASATPGGGVTFTVEPRRNSVFRLSFSAALGSTTPGAVGVSLPATVTVAPALAVGVPSRAPADGAWLRATPRAVPGGVRSLRIEAYVGRGRWRAADWVVPSREWRFPADRRGPTVWRLRWSGDATFVAATVRFRIVPRRAAAGAAGIMRGPLTAGWRAGALDTDRYRRAWADLMEGEAGLAGLRRRHRAAEASEMSYTLSTAAAYSRRGILSPDRANALARQLGANSRYFSRHRLPGAGKSKLGVPGSGLVWARFPGTGVQFHPVDSLLRVRLWVKRRNWGAARRSLDELLTMQVPRSAGGRRFAVSEYAFAYDGHPQPWISGMSEGLKLEALGILAGKGDASRARSYLAVAHRTLPAFETSWRSGGVLDRDGHAGRWYLEYAYSDQDRVLNGFQFALLGLARFSRDAPAAPGAGAQARDDAARAGRLFEDGVVEMVRHLPEYDLGRWSRYSPKSGRAPATYHWIHVRFLEEIARLTKNRRAAAICRRFAQRWGGGHASVVAGSVPRPEAYRLPEELEP